ncbi:hypothetical protein [Methylobacterium mesophilicum]|uniref:hypothetical protein n=1 Tax=Methylobacterium mesophilicum TaxID=39956 RepID=UPI002F353CE5
MLAITANLRSALHRLYVDAVTVEAGRENVLPNWRGLAAQVVRRSRGAEQNGRHDGVLNLGSARDPGPAPHTLPRP